MMRILRLTAGLGNQIFEYAVYLYFKRKYPKDRLYIFYNRDAFNEHNGYLEVTRHFDAELPQPPFWVKYWVYAFNVFQKYIGCKRWEDHVEPIIPNENLPLLYAYRNNKKYIPEDRNWIRFKEPQLSLQNQEILSRIESSDSVFLHVRRGDYLSPKYIGKFGGVCNIAYYQKAIAMMLARHPSAVFFVFSDDMQWVRKNLGRFLPRAVFVDWNKGSDSYLDMYLMAHCKVGIMANSTFSYWGAKLCQEKDIIYPRKWTNTDAPSPDIFEEDWQGI